MKKKIGILAGILLATGVLIAQVPHTFSPGDTLSSTKMNENFNYLTKLVKDGTGTVLGQLIGINAGTSPEMHIRTSKGYTFGVTTSGTISSINATPAPIVIGSQTTCGGGMCYYYNSACTSLLPAFSLIADSITTFSGRVFQYTGNLYYINSSGAPSTIYSDNTGCSVYSNNSFVGILNDPAITGVTSATYTMPITISNP